MIIDFYEKHVKGREREEQKLIQIVFEGKTLGDCAKQAEAFLEEFEGEETGETAAVNPAGVNPPSPKRGRGRRTNAEIIAEAQAKGGNGHQAPTPITSAASAAPAQQLLKQVTLPQVQQAMRELITHLGKGDVQAGAIAAKAVMEKEFAPHMRATDLPEAIWGKFVSRVEELTRPASTPAASAESLI